MLDAKIKEIYEIYQHTKTFCGRRNQFKHHAKTNEHIVFDMKTPFNGKMAFFAAISLHTLIVMSKFVTFYTNNWMKPPKQTIHNYFVWIYVQTDK